MTFHKFARLTSRLALASGATSGARERCLDKAAITRQLQSSSANSDFKSSQLQIINREAKHSKPLPDYSKLAFGQHFTDHMFEVEWDEKAGWGAPRISPLHSFTLHPAAKVLHYAQELFEGMKAFRGRDGKIRLFRPDMNMKRMHSSAIRSSFASFDMNELEECLKKLVELDQHWVPDAEGHKSLYIRPTMIGIEPTLGVASAKQALLYIIMSPVGGYFADGLKSINLIANPEHVRAWPGGCGDKKLGSNYGPTVLIQKEAEKDGFHQVLWLYGDDNQITEAGTMNMFVFLINEAGERELITPPLGDGLILPGITRDSILSLAREWGEFKVSERRVTMGELKKALQEARLLEAFGAGTACCVCPVGKISFRGEDIILPELTSTALSQRFLKALTDIQYGVVTPHPWATIVC